jgi:uncharacterized protein YqeY
MSALKTQIADTLKAAMRERAADTVMVIRNVQAAIKQIEIDTREELDDSRVLQVLEKQIKQRKESIAAFQQAGREELAAKEQFEIGIISQFLPVALDEHELDALIAQEISEQGATSIRDMGKVMNALRPKIIGRADASIVSAKIKAKLA